MKALLGIELVKMRGRSDGGQKKRLVITFCAVAILFGFLYAYRESIFGSSNHALEYGKSLRKLGSSYLGGDEDADNSSEESSQFGRNEGEDAVVPKNFPVSSKTA